MLYMKSRTTKDNGAVSCLSMGGESWSVLKYSMARELKAVS